MIERSYFELVCPCGETHNTEKPEVVCKCGRHLVVDWQAKYEPKPQRGETPVRRENLKAR